jgi:hypothetical protein
MKSVDAIGFRVVAIITKLIAYVKGDENKRSQSDRQARNVKKRMSRIFDH